MSLPFISARNPRPLGRGGCQPHDNDVGRVVMNDVNGLLELIRVSIDEQTNITK